MTTLPVAMPSDLPVWQSVAPHLRSAPPLAGLPVVLPVVALLNASYEPLGTVSFKHAVRMLFREVATVEESQPDRMIGPHPWPRVIRLVRYVATTWLYRPASYSRSGVLARDDYRCAYCGRSASTIDHVMPQSRGGGWTWLNTVAACGPCNAHKADRTPSEARMRLRHAPYEPTRAQLNPSPRLQARV